MAAEPRVINPDGSMEPRKIDVARPKLDKVVVQLKSRSPRRGKILGLKTRGIILLTRKSEMPPSRSLPIKRRLPSKSQGPRFYESHFPRYRWGSELP